MKRFDSALSLSATDLSNFLGCRHRTALDMAHAFGARKRPHFDDPFLEALFERGLAHERAYVEKLAAAGKRIESIADVEIHERLEPTLAGMRAGADVIVQGALQEGQWFGLPDVMQRIERPSKLGSWSYEIYDTKLARETRAGTILQLSLYTDLLARTQGTSPEYFHVVTPQGGTTVHHYRVDDYAAYYRLVRCQLEATVARPHEEVAEANYPEPVEHCQICPWCGECEDRWERDDHLSLVAGISRLQRRELESREIKTLAGLAQLPWPLGFKPNRGGVDGYGRIRNQARLQFESRLRLPPPLHELRPIEEGCGLCRLPEPSPGDVFLDLEGDPFAVEGGREYLFGLVTLDGGAEPSYRSWWAFTEKEERAAFEAVIDLIIDRLKTYPAMHVYHYAPYEPSAFKRLMGRYATRERELDSLLRSRRFIDLYAVVRQGLQAGVDRYSIKNLEILYGFERTVDLRDAGRCRAYVEQGLELQCVDKVPQQMRDTVEGYNKDDCLSTLALRDWLEKLRYDEVRSGADIARPTAGEGEAPPEVDERARRVEGLRGRLLSGVPESRGERNEEQQARWLLSYLLDWHRREDKAGWWEYFRLVQLPEEELFDEPDAVAGLEFDRRLGPALGKSGKPTKSVIDRYRYPLQEMDIGPGAELKEQTQERFGEVVEVDRLARTIDIRKGPKVVDRHPTAVFAHKHIDTGVLEESLFLLGETVAAAGTHPLVRTDDNPVARELLLRRAPRVRDGAFTRREEESVGDFVLRIGCVLDSSVLAIQGPPGSGKTYTGARMIRALVARGNRVGVVGPSHKVIENLLRRVVGDKDPSATPVRVGQKVTASDEGQADGPIALFTDAKEALAALQQEKLQVLGGTAWLWARPDAAGAVDVLFADEAGQMSLANVLAASQSTTNLVLLGDPQQLDQPRKGSHPDGVNVSALEHILGDHQTIPEDRGIFLPETWRLAPSICEFTSELFYEGRLRSKAGLEHQALTGLEHIAGSGLWIVDVTHEGNRTSSLEEVQHVAELVTRLTFPESRWLDEQGNSRPLRSHDILVIAPYNAHVTRLAERLEGSGVRVGTVDKFQGQQAPVVIYSMATSRSEEAPRGMEFLYSLNRLNVATSRAQCAAIVIACGRLLEPECRTPRQIRLANALCRYRELARQLDLPPREATA